MMMEPDMGLLGTTWMGAYYQQDAATIKKRNLEKVAFEAKKHLNKKKIKQRAHLNIEDSEEEGDPRIQQIDEKSERQELAGSSMLEKKVAEEILSNRREAEGPIIESNREGFTE